jgi:hypothetical protein
VVTQPQHRDGPVGQSEDSGFWISGGNDYRASGLVLRPTAVIFTVPQGSIIIGESHPITSNIEALRPGIEVILGLEPDATR